MKADELKLMLYEAKRTFLSCANGIEISEALESGLIDRQEFEQIYQAAQKEVHEWEILGTCMDQKPNSFFQYQFMVAQPGQYVVNIRPGRVTLMRMR